MAIREELPFDPEEDIKKYGAGAPKPSAPRKPVGRPPAATVGLLELAKIKESIEETYTLLGAFLGSMPNPKLQAIGPVISAQAEACADALVDAARKDKRLHKALSKLFRAGAYSAIVMAHLPILITIYMAYMPQPAEPNLHAVPNPPTQEDLHHA